MALEIGIAAPEFTLHDSEKSKITLSQYRGKSVLLLFFPQAFTGTCTAELCNMRDNIADYNNVNAQVFGISVDSVFTLAKFKEDQKFNFPLLSDFNKEVSTAYQSVYENWILDMKGVSKRSAFIIDKEGIIQYAEVLESAGDLPNFTAIQEKLNNIK